MRVLRRLRFEMGDKGRQRLFDRRCYGLEIGNQRFRSFCLSSAPAGRPAAPLRNQPKPCPTGDKG
jgi:hypothetical protein